MQINKVSIVIENIDEENASIKLITDPVPGEHDEIEDTPAVVMGSYVWAALQEVIGEDGTVTEAVSVTLQ
jgi:hypothetical protein